MKKLTAVIIAIILVMGVLSCSVDEKEVLLRFKFVEGQELVYEQATSGYISRSINDSLIFKNELSQKDTLSIKTVEVYNDSTAKIIISINHKFTSPDSIHKSNLFVDSLIINTIGELINNFNPSDSSGVFNNPEYKFAQLPTYPLITGQEWMHSVKDPVINNRTTIFKLVDFVEENNYDCAVISFTSNPKNVSQKITGFDEVEFEAFIIVYGLFYFAIDKGYITKQSEARNFKSLNPTQDSNGDSIIVIVEYATTTNLNLIEVR